METGMDAPRAVEALAELLPHYDRASVIEASR